VDALKDVADYVTDAIDEDGVANALARLGLV
jgi:hydroxymethylpyrimidine pyrophosphatase-like HAD family hydrolase